METIEISKKMAEEFIKQAGWSWREEWRVWSDGTTHAKDIKEAIHYTLIKRYIDKHKFISDITSYIYDTGMIKASGYGND